MSSPSMSEELKEEEGELHRNLYTCNFRNNETITLKCMHKLVMVTKYKMSEHLLETNEINQFGKQFN